MNIHKSNKRRQAFARVNKPRWWLRTIGIPRSWLEDSPCLIWRQTVADWTPTFEAPPAFKGPYVPFGLNARIVYGAKK